MTEERTMFEQIISLRGMGESRAVARKLNTRLIGFPDGVTRHITLATWQWSVFDRLARPESVLSPAEVVFFAYKHAKEDDTDPDSSFESKLRLHFSAYLMVGVPWTSHYIPPMANDC